MDIDVPVTCIRVFLLSWVATVHNLSYLETILKYLCFKNYVVNSVKKLNVATQMNVNLSK